MGTRGLFGFRLAGKDYLEYNHFDSYPSGLGTDIVTAWRTMQKLHGTEKIKEQVSKIRFVSQDKPPTHKEVEEFKKYFDKNANGGEGWYSLLRGRQGDIAGILKTGVIIEAGDFINDSLFCEWAYIINLDDNKLEVYKGFQTKPHKKGRYAGNKVEKKRAGENQYYPCALAASYNLDNIPEKWMKKSWS